MNTCISAVQHLRPLRGGAQAHLLRASDGNCYVTKFQNNPQHIKVLANEMLASSLGNLRTSIWLAQSVVRSHRWRRSSGLTRCLGTRARGIENLASGLSQRGAQQFLATHKQIQASDNLESIKCVHIVIQGPGFYSAVQGDSQAGRVPGDSIFPVVLAHGAVSADRSLLNLHA